MTIGGGSPWAVIQVKSIATGYTAFTACIKCTSVNQPLGQTYSMVLSQLPDCASALTTAASPNSALTLIYAASTTTQIATGWSDGLIQNLYLSDCGAISSCSIF